MGLFREYDLRGIVGQELTDSIAEQVGARILHLCERPWGEDDLGRARWPTEFTRASQGSRAGAPRRRTERGGYRYLPLAARVFLSVSTTRLMAAS